MDKQNVKRNLERIEQIIEVRRMLALELQALSDELNDTPYEPDYETRLNEVTEVTQLEAA